MTAILWYHQLRMAIQDPMAAILWCRATTFPQNARRAHRLNNMEESYIHCLASAPKTKHCLNCLNGQVSPTFGQHLQNILEPIAWFVPLQKCLSWLLPVCLLYCCLKSSVSSTHPPLSLLPHTHTFP